MLKRKRYNFITYMALCLAVYGIAVVAYAAWSNQRHEQIILANIDQQLLLAAKGLPFMLATDFHDRAIDGQSISFSEELRNRAAISGYARATPFKWVYTLAEKDGRFYFSAPTVSAAEARERRSWYFYPYADIPSAFVQAYRQKKTVFINYTDQWGDFRSVAMPQVSPGGRVYLACADYEISHLKDLLRRNYIVSLLTAVFFSLCSVPFILFSWGFFRSSCAELQAMNVVLAEQQTHLEDLVEERTRALQDANQRLSDELQERLRMGAILQEEKAKLETAMADVKALSGLLPICSACKKIRDDKGYWNQIESYFREHSEVEFTHGLCPECLARLYPDYAPMDGNPSSSEEEKISGPDV